MLGRLCCANVTGGSYSAEVDSPTLDVGRSHHEHTIVVSRVTTSFNNLCDGCADSHESQTRLLSQFARQRLGRGLTRLNTAAGALVDLECWGVEHQYVGTPTHEGFNGGAS